MNNHTVYLYCTFLSEVADLSLQSFYEKCMSLEESAQYVRFRFPSDKYRYLVTRALIRNVLSCHTTVAPEKLVFVKNSYGKPMLGFPELSTPLNFNISHSKNIVACSVTYESLVGVDVETVDRGRSALHLAKTVLSAREISHLIRLPLVQQEKRFIEYWTLKESYLKAVGTGFSLSLDECSFELEENQCNKITSIRLHNTMQHSEWAFWLLEPQNSERLAISVNVKKIGRPLQLVAYNVIPFKSITETIYPILSAPMAAQIGCVNVHC